MNWISRPSGRVHGEEEHAGHSACHEQACQPVPDEDGERMTMNAAVGPVTWKRDPPRSGTTIRDDGRVETVLWRHADRDGERHREREGDDATTGRERVAPQVGGGVAFSEDRPNGRASRLASGGGCGCV